MNPSVATVLIIAYTLSTLVSTAVMSVGFGVLVLTFLLLPNLGSRLRKIWHTPITRQYFIVSLILFSVLLLSSVVALLRDPPLYNHPLEVKLFQECKKLIYLFTPLMFFSVLDGLKTNGVWKVLKSYWLFLGFLGVIGVIQFFTGWPRAQLLPHGNSAAVLFMGLSLSVSSVLSLASFPLFSYGIERLTKKDQLPKELAHFPTSLMTFISLGMVLIIMLTFSRMSWLTLPIGLCVLFARRIKPKVFIGVLVLVGVLCAVAFYNSPSVKLRVTSRAGITDRLELWKGHLDLFKAEPILGVGFRQNSKLAETVVRAKYAAKNEPVPPEFFGSHAHNNWIEILAGAGLLGFVSFLLWNLFLLRMIWQGTRLAAYHWWFVGMGIGFLVFHLNGLTQVNFWDSKVLHTLMFLTGVSLFLTNKSRWESDHVGL